MKLSDPGMIVSVAAHTALLAAALVSFSGPPKFTDAAEAIPVDLITDSQFNDVMKGVRDAKADTRKPIVDRVADIEESKPKPVVNEAKVDIPTPPPPLKREPDPGEAETTPPPPPREQVAALPPPEPAPPVKPQPTPPEPPAPPVRPPEPKAEPRPEPKPEPPKVEEAEAIEAPTPPRRPKDLPKAVAAKPEPPKPKPPEKPKETLRPDKIAALLAEKKNDERKPAPRPRSGEESQEKQRKFDPGSITRLLSKEDPGQRASTGRAANQTAALGAPNANALRMSPSLWGQLDGYLQEQYKRCWNFMPAGAVGRYVPQIEVSYTESGMLAREPRLRNPPSDPALRSLADSALRAVRNPACNPLRIPARFQPYYEEWKDRILRFDPEEMMG